MRKEIEIAGHKIGEGHPTFIIAEMSANHNMDFDRAVAIMQAAKDAGADAVKLFPAGNLGPGYLKAMRAPLSHIDFLAVGGVDEKNVAEYIRAGAIGAGVGGNLAKKALIEAGKFDEIEACARALVEAVKSAK